MRSLLLISLLLLSGCAQYQQQIRDVGSRAFDEMEVASTLALEAAHRYECDIARVGPLLRKYNTPELREAWATKCQAEPVLPDLPGEPEATFE